MADADFRAEQWEHRFDAHVAPLNTFVDELGEHDKAGPPYIAPFYRGVDARGLAILRDPGPKAGGDRGSGFLCVENDDPTAERQCTFFAQAGIDAREVVPWNAYPWYINAAPSTTQLKAGTEPLWRMVELLPRLRVVLVLGGEAKSAWRYFEQRHGDTVRRRGIAALRTYHPGRQALWHSDPAVRDAREADIRQTFERAAAIMNDEI